MDNNTNRTAVPQEETRPMTPEEGRRAIEVMEQINRENAQNRALRTIIQTFDAHNVAKGERTATWAQFMAAIQAGREVLSRTASEGE